MKSKLFIPSFVIGAVLLNCMIASGQEKPGLAPGAEAADTGKNPNNPQVTVDGEKLIGGPDRNTMGLVNGRVRVKGADGSSTLVIVEKGEVRVQTAGGTATIGAGQKAVLTPDKRLLPVVNEPLVEDLLQIYSLVEAERAARPQITIKGTKLEGGPDKNVVGVEKGTVEVKSADGSSTSISVEKGEVRTEKRGDRIEGVLINVCSVDEDNEWKVAVLLEMPNKTGKPGTTCEIKNLAGLSDPRFYDMEGRLLEFDWKKGKNNEGPCDVKLIDPVAPAKDFRFICVGTSVPSSQAMRREGKLWHAWQANGSRNYLNYFRFILPKSAIFVQANRAPLAMDARDGRVALTIRNYTGEDADGAVDVAFLWPDKDGSTLLDIPPSYRQLRDKWGETVQEDYDRAMARIRAGGDFNDQSTPLATLLSRNAAMLHNNRERQLSVLYTVNEQQRKAAAAELDGLDKELGGAQGVSRTLIDPVKIIRTPQWSEQPAEGATHRIVMYGESIEAGPVFTMGLVYRQGKWFIQFNAPGRGHPQKQGAKPAQTAPGR